MPPHCSVHIHLPTFTFVSEVMNHREIVNFSVDVKTVGTSDRAVLNRSI